MSTPQASPQELNHFFSRVAPHYEWHTHLLTMLSDQRWRRFTVACLRLEPGDKVLDMASGTGQMACLAARHPLKPRVYALDINADMLALAKRNGRKYHIEFCQSSAHHTPFADNTFAAITMGFGFRIMPERAQFLNECLRILKPGGRVYFLETAPMTGWRRKILLFLQPRLPDMLNYVNAGLSGYRYLLDSMLSFPSLPELGQLFISQGFVAPRSHALSPGLAHLHIAEKP